MWGLAAILPRFWHCVRVDVCPFFGALDDEEFLVIEGSLAQLDRCNMLTWKVRSVDSCPKQPQQPRLPGVYPKRAHCFDASPFLMDFKGQPQELPSGESSDDCARGGDTSSSRWLRPWPRSNTTQPHGDTRRPGPGRRITRCTSRRRSGRSLLPRRQALSSSL